MNCQEFEIIVRDLAGDSNGAEINDARVIQRRTPTDISRRLIMRAPGACALRLQDERTLSGALASLVDEMKPLAPDPRVEQKLLEAFRLRVASTSGSPVSPVSPSSVQPSVRPVVAQFVPRARSRRTYWVTAAAAMLLLVVGAFALRALLSASSESQAGKILRP